MTTPRETSRPHVTVGTRETVRVPKMAELVVAQLRRQIITGQLQEGDALPPESELMEQFGVSRPTLREAFRVLESESLIAIRRGAHGGARVLTPSRQVAARFTAFMLEYKGVTLRDVYEARISLEVPAVGQLARSRTKADLAAVKRSLESHAASGEDPNAEIRLHGDFHMLIVRLAGNETLLLLSEMLHEIIETANTSLHANHAVSEQKASDAAVRTHRKVYEHLVNREGAAAEVLWRRHLVEALDYVVGQESDMLVSDLFT